MPAAGSCCRCYAAGMNEAAVSSLGMSHIQALLHTWTVCLHCHAEVCLGLYVLHTNKILHRDIKAANIFVGDNDCIKVCQSVSSTGI